MEQSKREAIHTRKLRYLQPAQWESWLRKAHDPDWYEHRYRDAKDHALASFTRELEQTFDSLDTAVAQRDLLQGQVERLVARVRAYRCSPLHAPHFGGCVLCTKADKLIAEVEGSHRLAQRNSELEAALREIVLLRAHGWVKFEPGCEMPEVGRDIHVWVDGASRFLIPYRGGRLKGATHWRYEYGPGASPVETQQKEGE